MRTFDRLIYEIEAAKITLSGLIPDWSLDKINALINSGIETKIQLTRPVAVHIIYLTAWVDEQDLIQFRQDVYARDALLARALRQKPPQFH